MKDLFKHTDVPLPNDCKVKISPSQISKFFTYPKIWYEENVLNIKNNELGYDCTGMLLGTILHKIYECVTNKKEITREVIDEALDSYLLKNPTIVANSIEIKNLYPLMSEVVVNEYILNNKCKKIDTEVSLSYKLEDGIYLAGTIDRIEDNTHIIDYKNVSTKPSNLLEIPFNYKIQLLSYALLQYKNTGIEPNRISIIYTVRPTKTLSARMYKVTEQINNNDWDMVNNTLQLITESLMTVSNNPSLTHLIFKSMELKNGY